jgi:hypothetical protein
VQRPDRARIQLTDLKQQLRDRLRADLHLGEMNAAPDPVGVVWMPQADEPRHLGVLFKVPVEDRVAKFLDDKEFRTNGKGHRRESSFVRVRELSAGKPEGTGYRLDQWSIGALKKKWLP